MRYFEDFKVGDVYELGEVHASAEQIIAFARQFDPQPFHIDPVAARDSPFGGLIASGWMTASLFMRRYVDVLLLDSACCGSPGVDEVRYLAPVRPDDRMTARLTVLAKAPMLGQRDRGLVKPKCELLDSEGRPVFSMVLHSIFLRRPVPLPS